jgi:hypothetical protein
LPSTAAIGEMENFGNSGSVHGENGGVTRDDSVGQGVFPKAGGSRDADTSHSSIQRNRLDFLFQQETNSFVPTPWSTALTEHVQAVFNAALQKALKAAVSPSSAP